MLNFEALTPQSSYTRDQNTWISTSPNDAESYNRFMAWRNSPEGQQFGQPKGPPPKTKFYLREAEKMRLRDEQRATAMAGTNMYTAGNQKESNMALALGNTGSMWGAGTGKPGAPGFTWYGQGPAPTMSKDQILADMGFMSAAGGWNPNGGGMLSPSSTGAYGNAPASAMLGGQMPGSNQQPQLGVPTAGGPGQMPAPAPGPAGLSAPTGGSDLKNYLAWAAANPAEAQKLATSRGGMTPTGDSGFQTYNPTMTPGAPKYGLAGAEEGLQRGLAGGIAGIEAGMNQAANTLSPYTQGGGKAFDLQQALSGALGPEAQKQAFANYNQSPEMAYALEQAEKGITRNAAATGKLGSGNVLQELQRNAIGMAQQDYGNAFNRLGSLSSMGQNSANLLGGLQANAGGKVGDYGFGTGQALADYRTRAGEQIAGNVANTGTQLSGMINQQGNDLSSLVGTQGSNIANLLAGYGSADAQTKQALATLLSNIATGSASQVAGVPGIPGATDSGMLGGIGNLAGGVGTLAQNPTVAAGIAALFSDARLKTNIQRIGKTARGNNLYTWDWNSIGADLAGNQPGFGVIAQEVSEDAVMVGPHGYLMVDYSRV